MAATSAGRMFRSSHFHIPTAGRAVRTASISKCPRNDRTNIVRNTLPTVPRMAPPGMSAVAMRSQVRATSAGPVPQPAFVQSISLGP